MIEGEDKDEPFTQADHRALCQREKDIDESREIIACVYVRMYVHMSSEVHVQHASLLAIAHLGLM